MTTRTMHVFSAAVSHPTYFHPVAEGAIHFVEKASSIGAGSALLVLYLQLILDRENPGNAVGAHTSNVLVHLRCHYTD